MEKRNKKKGFTLIEMVVVMAIIAILAAVAVPQAMKQINNAKKTADIAAAKEIASALMQGMAEGNTLTTNTTSNLPTWITNYTSYDQNSKTKKEGEVFQYNYNGTELKIFSNNKELYPDSSKY
ncbi:Type II secretion system protein G precursor [Caloramator mitchellensis]|uniref:Type II secretion system protein G n=1 Tax=Caloramator mitchellensis TaxID=908809 RepID=A0A0R3K6M2_CALMK|nr:type II secretion system protein [Caloramator mitchellensis]KRQ88079.1 Type II secretion system protein G precursor [Caloramator mitchellensis]